MSITLREVGIIATYLWLLRVPLVLAAVLAAFPLLAYHRDLLRAYLFGMYALEWPGMLSAGMGTVFYWLALSSSTNTLLQTAVARFNVPLLPESFRQMRQFPLLGPTPFSGCVIGLSMAYGVAALLFLGGLLAFTTADWTGRAAVVAGAAGALLLSRWFAGEAVDRKFQKLAQFILWPTKISPDGYRIEGRLDKSHVFAAGMVSIFGVLYAMVGLVSLLSKFRFATLPCVLMVLTILCWVLGSVTYFYDRWRFSTFAVVVIVALIGFDADHVFRLERAKGVPQTTAAAMMNRGRLQCGTILVATSGGGILASAWTATVLGELSKERMFLQRLQLISGVSGGSVGAMHFAHQLKEAGARKIDPKLLLEAASESSLEAVAWGVTYPDMLRVAFPFIWRSNRLQHVDRGWALEKAWVRHYKELQKTKLMDWEAGDGMPALIFNSTVNETSERFVFANYHVGPLSEQLKQQQARRVFYEEFPEHDIRVATAVRMSAAFPYVSPVAKAVDEHGETFSKKDYHLADGGYYDNYGVASALDFVADGVAPGAKDRILLVLIEAGPENAFKDTTRGDKGWGFQAIAPPYGLLRLWQIVARARNAADLDWAKRYASGLTFVRFVYRDNTESPTSWSLNPDQKASIDKQFKTEEGNVDALRRLRAWMSDDGPR